MGRYNHDPPVDRHVDQLHAYMAALDADYGQVVYVNKADQEIRPWPDGAPFTFDEQRWEEILARCHRVRDTLYDHGVPTTEEELDAMFEPCDEFFCGSEDLTFEYIPM